MKTLWLVYEQKEVARNRFFVSRWEEAAKARGVRLHLVFVEELTFGIKDHRPFLAHQKGLPLPDFAVMRLNRPALSLQLEAMGVLVYNNAWCAQVFNDKCRTHLLLSPHLPMMDTVFLRGDEEDSPLPYPVVVKAAHSAGGRLVFLAHDQAGFQAAVAAVAPDQALVQPLCDTPGRDLRVYILGNQVYQTMMRVSEHDFRSNVGQGGQGVPAEMTPAVTEMVNKVLSQFDIAFGGIDFIKHRGEWLFNEIEDAVGTRMLYALNKRDPVFDYLDLILRGNT